MDVMPQQYESYFDHNSRSHMVRPVDVSERCVVCDMPSQHSDRPQAMGVYGVSGHYYCSMECHDSMECPCSSVVFSPVVVPCMGMRASSMMVQCPSCAYRSEMARRRR